MLIDAANADALEHSKLYEVVKTAQDAKSRTLGLQKMRRMLLAWQGGEMASAVGTWLSGLALFQKKKQAMALMRKIVYRWSKNEWGMMVSQWKGNAEGAKWDAREQVLIDAANHPTPTSPSHQILFSSPEDVLLEAHPFTSGRSWHQCLNWPCATMHVLSAIVNNSVFPSLEEHLELALADQKHLRAIVESLQEQISYLLMERSSKVCIRVLSYQVVSSSHHLLSLD